MERPDQRGGKIGGSKGVASIKGSPNGGLPRRGKGKGKGKQLFFCQEYGHIARDCQKKAEWLKGKGRSNTLADPPPLDGPPQQPSWLRIVNEAIGSPPQTEQSGIAQVSLGKLESFQPWESPKKTTRQKAGHIKSFEVKRGNKFHILTEEEIDKVASDFCRWSSLALQ